MPDVKDIAGQTSEFRKVVMQNVGVAVVKKNALLKLLKLPKKQAVKTT